MAKLSMEDKKALRRAKRKEYIDIVKNSNKQRLVTYLGYIFLIILIIVASSLSVFFDLEHFSVTDFAVNLCFSVAISIIALLLSIKDGELSNENRKSGEYFDAKQNFGMLSKKIASKEAFRQYNDLLYRKERESYIEQRLIDVNITNVNYLRLDREDLEELCVKPKICKFRPNDDSEEMIEKPFDRINPVQFATIMKLKKGDFKFPKINYTYFLARDNHSSYQFQAKIQGRPNYIKIFGIIYRLTFLIILSGIFTLTAVNPSGSSAGQLALSTISRIFTFISSCFFGYTLANLEMKSTLSSLLFKNDMIEDYLKAMQTGAFVPIDIEEEILSKIKALENDFKQDEVNNQLNEENVLNSDLGGKNNDFNQSSESGSENYSESDSESVYQESDSEPQEVESIESIELTREELNLIMQKRKENL